MARIIPNSATKIVTSGTSALGAEQWQFALWFLGYTESGEGALDLTAFAAAAPWTAFLTDVAALNPASWSILQMDSYWYQGNAAVAHQQVPKVVPGTNAVTMHPLTVSAVMTLRTGLATRSGRGRIYLPAQAQGVNPNTGTFSAAAINACVTTLATALTSIGSGTGITPAVVSQTHGSYQQITAVDADLVPDTQRRRENKVRTARFSVAVTH